MTVVCRTLGFAMASGGGPGSGQIVKAVPMNSRRPADEQLRRPAQAELLHFFGAKARDPHFGHPQRQVADSGNFLEPLGPLVNLPMIPVERESMQGDHVEAVEN